MVTGGQAGLTYKDAGVDIDAKMSALQVVARLAATTHTPAVLTGLGSFGSLFRPDFSRYTEPVLVGSTDGVGTKLLVAQRVGRLDTVGADLVNHCIDDILVMGAEPLFFLDYVAAGRLVPGMLESIVRGFVDACRAGGVALVGGETAEMPGVYPEGHFDLAGFIVGVVDRCAILGAARVREGDVVLALRSSGLHTNGYSLAQKILFEKEGLVPEATLPGLGHSIGDALLAVHRSYLGPVRGLLREPGLHALAHITGGGFTDNVPRVLPQHLDVVLDRDAWRLPLLFLELMRRGPVAREEMDRTFNMGLGLLLLVDPAAQQLITRHLVGEGEEVLVVGRVETGQRRVRYEGRGES